MGSAMRKTGSTATPIRAFTDSALHTDRVKTSDFRLARTAYRFISFPRRRFVTKCFILFPIFSFPVSFGTSLYC